MADPALRADTGVVEAGLAAAWPICLGYFPIGLSLGVLAQKSGLQPWQMALMSLLVFAGGSQFIAVAMLEAKGAPVTIVITTFMVNLRHLLMSSSLSLHFPHASRTHPAAYWPCSPTESPTRASPSTWPASTGATGTCRAP